MGEFLSAVFLAHLFDEVCEGYTSSDTTLLMYTAERGNRYLVEQLIASGCDVSAKNKLGKTALDYANEKGYVDVADVLKG